MDEKTWEEKAEYLFTFLSSCDFKKKHKKISTPWGSKTKVGLYLSIKRMINEEIVKDSK